MEKRTTNYLSLILLDALEDENESDIDFILERYGQIIDPSFVLQDRGIAPIHYVCGIQNESLAIEVTKRFLWMGADPNCRSEDKMTPLHVAAISGRAEIVRLLLQYGADLDVIDGDRKTPASYAIAECNFEVLQVMKDHIFLKKYKKKIAANSKILNESKFENSLQQRVLDNKTSTYSTPQHTPSKNDSLKIVTNKNLLKVTSSPNGSFGNNNESNKFTPNRIHYNYDATSPYYINITHRRHKPQPKFPDIQPETNLLTNDPTDYVLSTSMQNVNLSSPETVESVNLFSLTKETLEELTQRTNVSEKSRRSYIEIWRQKVQKSRARKSIVMQFDDVIEMINQVVENDNLNFTNIELNEVKDNKTKELNFPKADITEKKTLLESQMSFSQLMPKVTEAKVQNSLPYHRRLCSPFQNTDKTTEFVENKTPTNSLLGLNKLTVTATQVGDFESDFSKIFSPLQNTSQKIEFAEKTSSNSQVGSNNLTATKAKEQDFYVLSPLQNANKKTEFVENQTTTKYQMGLNNLNVSKSQVRDFETDNRKMFSPLQTTRQKTEFADNKIPTNSQMALTQIQGFKSNYQKQFTSLQNIDIRSEFAEKRTPTKSQIDLNKVMTTETKMRDFELESRETEFAGTKTPAKSKFGLSQLIEAHEKKRDCEPDYRKIFSPPQTADRKTELIEEKIPPRTKMSFSQLMQTLTEAKVENFEPNHDNLPSSLQNTDFDSSYQTVPELIIASQKNIQNKQSEKVSADFIPSTNNNQYILQMTEAYMHTDDENGLVFYETKLLGSVGNKQTLERNQCSPKNSVRDVDTTVTSQSTNITLPLDYETDNLRAELTAFGEPPGPITKTTKKLYIKRLVKYKRNITNMQERLLNEKKIDYTFSIELHRTLRSEDNFQLVKDYFKYETQSAEYFEGTVNKKEMREGHLKQSFIYMLIDPRISCNLPAESVFLDEFFVWKRFLKSIFYVGKGKAVRPYSHLYDAMKTHSRLHNKHLLEKTDKNGKKISIRKLPINIDSFKSRTHNPTYSKKLERILNIWSTGKGVVCLHVFHNILPIDAYTREAAIIDALSLQHLTNCKRGDYYGPSKTWTMREKKYFGIALLFKAMRVYLAEGESQLSPSDLI